MVLRRKDIALGIPLLLSVLSGLEVNAWTHLSPSSSTTPKQSRLSLGSQDLPTGDCKPQVNEVVLNEPRRSFLKSVTAAAVAVWGATCTEPAFAAEDEQPPSSPFWYERKKDKLAYKIKIPAQFKETQKPVKTHLDEVNFMSETTKGYQYGITVDPVRINSLKEVRTWTELIPMRLHFCSHCLH